jgi:hypothetical protein
MDLDLSGVPPAKIKPGAQVKGLRLPPDLKVITVDVIREATLGGQFEWKGRSFPRGTQLWFSPREPQFSVQERLIFRAQLGAPQKVGDLLLPAGTFVSFRGDDPGKLAGLELGEHIIEIEGCQVTQSVSFSKAGELEAFKAAAPCTWHGVKVNAGQTIHRSKLPSPR